MSFMTHATEDKPYFFRGRNTVHLPPLALRNPPKQTFLYKDGPCLSKARHKYQLTPSKYNKPPLVLETTKVSQPIKTKGNKEPYLSLTLTNFF